MRRFHWMAVSLLLVVVLVAVEIFVIKSASKYEPQVEVIFAKTRIAERTPITSDMVETRKIGANHAHRQSIANAGEVLGKKARMDIEAGEMLLSGKLSREGMEEIRIRDKNKRLFSVEFKGDQANGWWLMTDQQVDIIFVPNEVVRSRLESVQSKSSVEHRSQEQALATYMGDIRRLRNVRIAAMMDDRGQLLKNSGRQTLPKYISFEVTDEQADFLAYAKGAGRLELALIPGQ